MSLWIKESYQDLASYFLEDRHVTADLLCEQTTELTCVYQTEKGFASAFANSISFTVHVHCFYTSSVVTRFSMYHVIVGSSSWPCSLQPIFERMVIRTLQCRASSPCVISTILPPAVLTVHVNNCVIHILMIFTNVSFCRQHVTRSVDWTALYLPLAQLPVSAITLIVKIPYWTYWKILIFFLLYNL